MPGFVLRDTSVVRGCKDEHVRASPGWVPAGTVRQRPLAAAKQVLVCARTPPERPGRAAVRDNVEGGLAGGAGPTDGVDLRFAPDDGGAEASAGR